MALPTSGPLSILDIKNQLSIQYDLVPPYSLRNLSSLAGFSTPDSISEFYGYGGGGTQYTAAWNTSSKISLGYFEARIIVNDNEVVYSEGPYQSGTFAFYSGDTITIQLSASSDASYCAEIDVQEAAGSFPVIYTSNDCVQDGKSYAELQFTAPAYNININIFTNPQQF
jgi:hypothetical protein